MPYIKINTELFPFPVGKIDGNTTGIKFNDYRNLCDNLFSIQISVFIGTHPSEMNQFVR